MNWKTRLLLTLLALGTVAGYGSALARARHCHGPHATCDKSACHLKHGPVDSPPTTP